MRILITGYEGFIGKNTYFQLRDNFQIDTIGYGRGNNEKELEDLIIKSDYIIHCAGVNITNDDSNFKKTNFGLTKKICDLCIKLDKKIPIIFTSSIHAEKDNPYGRSKLAAEEELFAYSNNTGAKVYIFRLPHVMGKWCKPNYNSVIATFCYNIAHEIKIEINPLNPKINIIYIDDLIEEFNNLIISRSKESQVIEVKKKYSISIQELADEIYAIKNSSENLSINGFSNGLKKALYSTYLSYQPENNFTYKLKSNEDERGKFVEIIKSDSAGQFSFLSINKEKVRGEHYHHSKTEKFFVISGKVKFTSKDILSEKITEIVVDENDNKIVDTIPGWTHQIENVGTKTAKIIIWANEIFDPNRPDTIQKKIS